MAKKAYQKPKITSEKVFEEAALQCTFNYTPIQAPGMTCCLRKGRGSPVIRS